MIELRTETLIALRDAPKHLPARPDGKRLHISAVYRWITKGVAGIVLEAVRVGGTTYTSLEALQRFADRLSQPAQRVPIPVATTARWAARQGAQRALEIELGLPLPGSSPKPTPGDPEIRLKRSENTAPAGQNRPRSGRRR